MTEGGTRDTNVTTAVNRLEKGFFERVAEAYESSQASVNRMVMEERYRALFGDIHPEALDRHDIDADAILRGDLDPEEVPDKYKMDGDGPAQVPATDGGAVSAPTPSSYTPTYTPQDLADGGAELTWDELKDAVERHWADSLEIHPDRVRPGEDVDVADDGTYDHDDYALRANQTTVAKILTAILRSKSEQVPEKVLEETILEFTDHQINRVDEEAGRRYKVETYRKILVKKFGYLVPHPDPLKDIYYTSEAAAQKHFGKEVETTIETLLENSEWVLDPREHAQEKQVNPKEDPRDWVDDLASFRQRLGFLKAILDDGSRWVDDLADLDDDRFDDHPTAEVAVRKTYNKMLDEYMQVNQWARFAAANAVLEIDNEHVLKDEVLRNDEFQAVNADRPAQPVTEWVVERETPLSGPAQIAEVAEKL